MTDSAQGYHFDPNLAKKETDVYLALAKRQHDAGDEYATERNYMEMRQPHEGPIHILLVTGLVGSFFFVAYCAALLIFAFGAVVKIPSRQVTPIQIWAVALILPQVVGFFTVFGDLTNFLIQVCPIITLLYRTERLKKILQEAPLPNLTEEASAAQPHSGISTAAFGWHSRPPTVAP